MPLQFRRTVILSNAIAFVAVISCTIILVYMLDARMWKWSLTTEMTGATILLLVSIFVFNNFHKFTLSRFLLSIILPAMSMLMMMVPRISDPSLYSYLPRSPNLFCAVITTSVVPLMVFFSREAKYMFTALAINLLILVSIDPVLFIFSVDYRASEYTFGRFVANNMVLLVAEFFLIGCIVFLKTLFEHFEKENVELISSLNDKNAELKIRNTELNELNRNIEIQNIEIQAQSTELMQSQESLVEAHHEIERQKAELQNKNVQLEQSLDDKSKDLLHTNQHLIAQNNGLQQFSYTISHNLRGPVASMLGLINIYHLSSDEDDKASIFSQLERSVQSLETVIIDLNKIIDIRRDTFNINEKVSLEKEVKQIIQSLHVYITENDVQINLDFQRPEIFSIKAYINSILYNLISNAIQYRSLDRKSIINISSYSKSDIVIIEISDNGIGIDLNRFRDDLFKLYKRFHSHIEGKGVGLYIVKQQVEKLNGTIEVQSEPDKGTRFIVSLKDNQQDVLEVKEQ
jgi:signal transduction histidine kinase